MTFDPFGDFEKRGYLRNYLQLKEQSKLSQVEFNNYRTVLPDALAYLEKCNLYYDDILKVHECLFSNIYPWAGQDRSITAPNIAITKNNYCDLFCHPLDCQRAGTDALARMSNLADVAKNPGDIYSQLCYAHPFLDGNGRTLLLVHSEMLRRASIHIRWEDIDPSAFLRALTDDLQKPNKDILNTLLRPHIVPEARNLDDLKTALVDQIRIHGKRDKSLNCPTTPPKPAAI